jgi:Dolichyl-phosphate-mannose-protein mannosyltransferase
VVVVSGGIALDQYIDGVLVGPQPSAIAGSLTIPVVWLLVRDVTGSLNTAHLTAALVTFNPLHLWYSQEARPYAMLFLAVCLATFCLAHALRSGSRSGWVGFTGFTVLAGFIHLIGFVLLLFVGYVGIMFLASALTGKAYSVRYTLPGLIGFLGLVGAALHRARTPLGPLCAALLLVLFAWADAQWFFSPSYRKDDSRAVVRWLSRHLPPGSEVAVAPRYATKVVAYYASKQNAELHIIPVTPNARWSRNAPAALLLTRLHHVPDPAGLVASFRSTAGGELRSHQGIGYEVFLRSSDPVVSPCPLDDRTDRWHPVAEQVVADQGLPRRTTVVRLSCGLASTSSGRSTVAVTERTAASLSFAALAISLRKIPPTYLIAIRLHHARLSLQ